MTRPDVRELRPAEVPAVAAFRRSWDVGTDRGVEDDAGFDARFAAWLGAEDRRTFWVAWDGDRPVGLAGLLEYRAMPSPGRPPRCWGYLGNMYVAAEHRDRGLGRRLLDTVLAAADARGYVRVLLAPSPRSVPFYRRAGFVDAGPDAGHDRLLVRPGPPTRR